MIPGLLETIKGDGVELRRFFYHLFVVMKSHPRQARIDTPGALHHIICRGIERRNIFKDNTDRNRFLERLVSVLQKTSTPCYGWALIPNHFHPFLKTGRFLRFLGTSIGLLVYLRQLIVQDISSFPQDISRSKTLLYVWRLTAFFTWYQCVSDFFVHTAERMKIWFLGGKIAGFFWYRPLKFDDRNRDKIRWVKKCQKSYEILRTFVGIRPYMP